MSCSRTQHCAASDGRTQDLSIRSLMLPKTSSPRATIAHLRVNKYSHWTKWLYFFFFVVVEDLIKIEDAGVTTTLKIDFSNIQGQLTLQSRVESG